jgi:hypothetical protein
VQPSSRQGRLAQALPNSPQPRQAPTTCRCPWPWLQESAGFCPPLPFHPSLPSRPEPPSAPRPKLRPKPKRQERIRAHSAQTWLPGRKTESYRSTQGYSIAKVKTSSTGWQGPATHGTEEGKSLRSGYLKGFLPDEIQDFTKIWYNGQVPRVLRALPRLDLTFSLKTLVMDCAGIIFAL